MKTRLLLILFSLCFSSNFAQKKLANKFYNNFGYIKAAELYELTVEKGDSSLRVLTRLGDSYYNNGKTEASAKWYELAVQKYADELESEYIYKYIQSLVSTKRYDEATEWANKLIEMQNENAERKTYIQEGFDVYKLSPETDERLIIKLNNLDFNSQFSDFGSYIKGNTMYFSSARDKSNALYAWNKEPFLDIYQTEINRGGEKISFDNTKKLTAEKVNSAYHESSIAITKDGKTLYFTRDNVTKTNRLDYARDGTTHLKIYKATLSENNVWADIEELNFNDEVFSTAFPALNPDETQLYFSSDREDGFGSSDLYVVDINSDGTYSEPRNLGPKVNTPGRESFPFISDDNTLYYSSDGLLNYGLLDIYKSNIINDSSAKSENLGEPYNSGYDDFAYIVDSETQEGYLSSNREGGVGSDDIYGFNAYICEQTIEGVTLDKRTQEPLPVVQVRLLDEDGKLLKETTSDENGVYKFESVLCEHTYTVVANKDDYKQVQTVVSTDDVSDKANKNIDLELEPLIIDNEIVLNPIFFDFDKAKIRTDAAYELENIVDVMRKHPTMVIKIEAHTDSRGPDGYNMRLSDRRAKATRDYLISRDIDANRIESAIGYGESQLLNKCSNGVKCSKDEHQLNRRSKFYIIKQ